MNTKRMQQFEHVQAETIEARRLAITDEDGNRCILAYVVQHPEEKAGPRLAFMPVGGDLDAEPLAVIDLEGGRSRLCLHSPDGNPRALLESGVQGGRLALIGDGLDGSPRADTEPGVELYARGEGAGVSFAGVDRGADGTPYSVPLLDLGARNAREAFFNMYRRASSGELEPAAILPPEQGDESVGGLASQIAALVLAWCESTGREPEAVLTALRDLGELTTAA